MLMFTWHMRCMQGGLDFQDLLEQHPDAVMEYIVKHGTTLLGTFKCKVIRPRRFARVARKKLLSSTGRLPCSLCVRRVG